MKRFRIPKMRWACRKHRDSPLRSVLVLSICFMLVFTGYGCSVNLLSSLNIEQGLGVISQSVLYAVFALASFTVPPYCMKKIGVRNSVAFSAMLYAPYVASNFYPSWYTFIPSAVMVGLAAGPLWVAAVSYLTVLAKRQTNKDAKSMDSTMSFYFGLFFTFFGMSGIFGNLVSFYILKPEHGQTNANLSREALAVCGVNFCDWKAIESGVIIQPPRDKVWLLTGVYTTCVLLGAFLVWLLLDNVNLTELGVVSEESTSFKNLALAPLKMFKVAKPWYILPITIYAGMADSFQGGDFTKAYMACSLGIYQIGLAMISTGIVLCISSFLVGLLLKVIDRAYVYVAVCLIDAITYILLWYWTPDTPIYVLFIIPAMWGVVNSVLQCQLRALYGIMFPDVKDAAFAAHSALQAVGFLIGFAISSQICTMPKLWTLSILLLVSMIGYVVGEISHRRSKAQVFAPNSTPSKDINLLAIWKES